MKAGKLCFTKMFIEFDSKYFHGPLVEVYGAAFWGQLGSGNQN